MKPPFAHFIFIRFSVPIEWGKTGITVNDEWLKYRWEIFNRITLPSLKNQINQNFRILIFFDKRSPQWLIDENEKTAKGYSKYIPFYVESSEDLKNQSNIFLQSLYDKEGWTHLIASRIDSDDAYHKDAVTAIQDRFVSQDFTVINFAKILCFSDRPAVILSRYIHKLGPFVNFIYKTTPNIRCMIFDHSHRVISSLYEVKQLYFPFALQYIHGGNVANHIKGKAARGIDLRDYGINFDIDKGYILMTFEVLKSYLRKRKAEIANSFRKRIGIFR